MVRTILWVENKALARKYNYIKNECITVYFTVQQYGTCYVQLLRNRCNENSCLTGVDDLLDLQTSHKQNDSPRDQGRRTCFLYGYFLQPTSTYIPLSQHLLDLFYEFLFRSRLDLRNWASSRDCTRVSQKLSDICINLCI